MYTCDIVVLLSIPNNYSYLIQFGGILPTILLITVEVRTHRHNLYIYIDIIPVASIHKC